MMHHALWSEAWTAAIINHLWQSTLFFLVAWAVTIILRNNQARTRYWIWMIASLKFLIPFSILIDAGGLLRTLSAAHVQNSALTTTMVQVVQPFPQISPADILIFPNNAPIAATPANPISYLLAVAWLFGSFVFVTLWVRNWIQGRSAVRSSRQAGLMGSVPILISKQLPEPAVFGVFRPVLLLPEAIKDHLSESQLHSIIAHEMCHISRRDNLSTAIHMMAQAVFWFHPAVWWIKARLLEERERACDEAVLQSGAEAQLYAESILKVCRFCVEYPIACMSGVSGSHLKQRIMRIMTGQTGRLLDFNRKLMLSMVGTAVLALPVLSGFTHIIKAHAQAGQAQLQAGTRPSFEVASIKVAESCGNTAPGVRIRIPSGPSYQPGGRFSTCSQLKYIVMDAYQIDVFSGLTGVPDWSEDILYKIEAKAEGNPDKEQMRLMVQSLLEERFKLKLHRETKDTPVYLLVIAKGGHKLQPAKDEKGNPIVSLPSPEQDQEKRAERMRNAFSDPASMPPGSYFIMGSRSGHELNGKAMSMNQLAAALFSLAGKRKVIDRTGLTGLYDIQVRFADPYNPPSPPDAASQASAAEPSAPTIFKALQEQLGLKLEEDKAALDHFVIDSVGKPSEN